MKLDLTLYSEPRAHGATEWYAECDALGIRGETGTSAVEALCLLLGEIDGEVRLLPDVVIVQQAGDDDDAAADDAADEQARRN